MAEEREKIPICRNDQGYWDTPDVWMCEGCSEEKCPIFQILARLSKLEECFKALVRATGVDI